MAEQGIRIVFDNFDYISGNMRSKAGRIVAATARAIAAEAKANVPVLSGDLQDSITAQQAGTFSWTVTAGTDHNMYVEYGTGHGPAQPYMTPAAHKTEPKFQSDLTTIVDP